jgi:hypothetical protein
VDTVEETAPGATIVGNIELPGPSNPTSVKPRPHTKYAGAGNKRSIDSLEEQMMSFVREEAKLDEHELFAKAMACKLRRMSDHDSKLAAECELKIHTLIHEAEISFM